MLTLSEVVHCFQELGWCCDVCPLCKDARTQEDKCFPEKNMSYYECAERCLAFWLKKNIKPEIGIKMTISHGPLA